MTASEPLSFEEEVAMQVSWREDDKSDTLLLSTSVLPWHRLAEFP